MTIALHNSISQRLGSVVFTHGISILGKVLTVEQSKVHCTRYIGEKLKFLLNQNINVALSNIRMAKNEMCSKMRQHVKKSLITPCKTVLNFYFVFVFRSIHYGLYTTGILARWLTFS